MINALEVGIEARHVDGRTTKRDDQTWYPTTTAEFDHDLCAERIKRRRERVSLFDVPGRCGSADPAASLRGGDDLE